MLQLRPARPDDLDHLIRWVDSLPALVQWAGPQLFRYPVTPQQFAAYLDTARGTSAASEILTGIDAQSGVPVAHGEMGMINREQETASLCRILTDPALRGRGIGRALVHALLVRGFDELHLRRIDLRVYAHNAPAIRCYESEGFVKEGLLRQSTRVGDTVWDVVVMSVLKNEWVNMNSVTGERV
jgi:RimJ/RimL family protein N-acetyltransferase